MYYNILDSKLGLYYCYNVTNFKMYVSDSYIDTYVSFGKKLWDYFEILWFKDYELWDTIYQPIMVVIPAFFL